MDKYREENFKDAEEFIDCFRRGGELVFSYGAKRYSLGQFYVYDIGNECETEYPSADAMLDHPVGGGKHIRDILQDMVVTDRPLY